MKTFLVLILVLLGVWIPIEVAYIHRLTSAERVKTRIAVKLTGGTNHLYLSLPRGSYVCAFSNEPELKPAFTAAPSNSKEIQPDTVILRDGRTLVSKKNTQWVKFHVTDNNYSVVEIQTVVPQESRGAVYLVVGGAF